MDEILCFDKKDEFNQLIEELDAFIANAPKHELTKEIIQTKELSKPFFAQHFPTSAGIYTIWVGDQLAYIGKASNLRERLKWHSVYSPNYDKHGKRTTPDSKRDEVLEALETQKVFFSVITIEPEQMRAGLESGLQKKPPAIWCDRID